MNTTSILPDYIHCIGKQLLNALNDQGQLGQIYQGLTKYISAKYGGSHHLPRLKYQACARSPTARTLYLLEREYEIHVHTTIKDFPIKQSAIELAWLQTAGYALFSQDQKQTTKKYLNKLHTYNITTLAQIQNPDTHHILSPKEFKQKFKVAPKLIKEALAQTQLLFPHNPPTTHNSPPQHVTTLIPPINTNNQVDPTSGKPIQDIINTKTTTHKDKWGAKAIKQHYLCQWNTPPANTTKWVEASLLLHHDNVALDHNIYILHKFLRNQQETNTLTTYNSCINFRQSKDQRFIRPPIIAPNLTLITKECNPDKDIITTKPTIQIQGTETNIYDPTGAYVLTMPLTRLQWLWERYSQSQTHPMLHFLNPPPQDFTTEILWLTQRYVTILPKRKPKKHNPNNNHQTLHPSTLQALIEAYNITHSYYSSPLTCPTTITQYNSPYNRDIIFGSTGLAHSSKWTGNGLAHPPDLKTAMTSIH
jgi:hypothetical protein